MGGVDQCFPGDFSQGSQPCAQVAGGYNITTFASLLQAGKGADGKEGSLCDPKVSLLCLAIERRQRAVQTPFKWRTDHALAPLSSEQLWGPCDGASHTSQKPQL